MALLEVPDAVGSTSNSPWDFSSAIALLRTQIDSFSIPGWEISTPATPARGELGTPPNGDKGHDDAPISRPDSKNVQHHAVTTKKTVPTLKENNTQSRHRNASSTDASRLRHECRKALDRIASSPVVKPDRPLNGQRPAAAARAFSAPRTFTKSSYSVSVPSSVREFDSAGPKTPHEDRQLSSQEDGEAADSITDGETAQTTAINVRRKLKAKSRLALLNTAVQSLENVVSDSNIARDSVSGQEESKKAQRASPEDGGLRGLLDNCSPSEVKADVPLYMQSRRILQPKSRLTVLDRAAESRKSVISDILGLQRPTASETKTGKGRQAKTLPATTLSAAAEDSAAQVNAARRTKLASLIFGSSKRPIIRSGFLPASVSPPDTSPSTQEDIHVFVDVSNILIGFQDTLKEKRGFKKMDYMPWARFSFTQFAMLIEWGRPTAKRILVGSDTNDCIREAQAIGYECNILKRVQKERSTGHGKNDAQSGHESGASKSDDARPTSRRPRTREQAVDEVLQLKMLESVVDAPKAAKIILATGDAAAGEYSDGFLRMAERAMMRGWAVEIACFAANRSKAWSNIESSRRWAGKFSIVELDQYLELLKLET